MNIPVIAIDGPTASGKGTVARRLAKHFGFNYLNSGALYRLTAYIASKYGIDFANEEAISEIGEKLSPIFLENQVLVDGMDVWPELNKEIVGKLAASISSYSKLRNNLLAFQKSQAVFPGLVAEGRDMTSEVFKDSEVKIYLDASPEAQAKRRFKEEQSRNSEITFDELVLIMERRNLSDSNRVHGKLQRTEDSYYIDTTDKTPEEVFELALNYAKSKLNLN
jgi:cytidylate kinase